MYVFVCLFFVSEGTANKNYAVEVFLECGNIKKLKKRRTEDRKTGRRSRQFNCPKIEER